MVKLRVKNFGPVKNSENDDYLLINKFTVFIGEQGSGKSTIAKLFSTFSWLEKDFYRNPKNEHNFGKAEFINCCANQKIEGYFTSLTIIDFIGESFEFHYSEKGFYSKRVSYSYRKPKIMYIPSERNLLTVLDKAENIQKLPLMLKLLQTEFNKALNSSETGLFLLPVKDFKLLYDRDTKIASISNNDSIVRIQDSSSGLQSLVPISIVSNYLIQEVDKRLVDIIKDFSVFDISQIKNRIFEKLNDTVISDHLINVFDHDFVFGKIDNVNKADYSMINEVIREYVNTCFINIVEEPEQNLFPISQVEVLEELINVNNSIEYNKLLITTHSPYILSALNNYIYANDIFKRKNRKVAEISPNLYLNIDEVSAYRIQNGIIFSIINRNYNLIDTTQIDDCSSIINSIYDKLIEVDNEE